MPGGIVSLGYLRLQAKQRSDMQNNPFISDPEWNGYITNSYKELYDLVLAAYGNDYYAALPYQFSLTGTATYNLPDGSSSYTVSGATAPAFYKLLGVDLQNSSSPTGWVTLRNFEFIERNKYASPNTSANTLGRTNLRYRLLGNQIWFAPTPAAGQLAQIWYAPEPTNLQVAPIGSFTANSAVVTLSDIAGITVGMSAYTESAIPSTASYTVSSINTGTKQVTLSGNANATLANQTVLFWSDATTIDGISGWEEFIIIDAAIKAFIKKEDDISGLAVMKASIVKRIEAMAEGRDAGQAHHVSDALGANGFGYDDDGFGGMGGMGGF